MGYSPIGYDEFLHNIVKLQAHKVLLTKSVDISISKKDQKSWPRAGPCLYQIIKLAVAMERLKVGVPLRRSRKLLFSWRP